MTAVEDLKAEARLLRARTDIDYLCQEIGARPLPAHARKVYDIIMANQAAGIRTEILTAPGTLKSTVFGICMVQNLLGPDPHILFATKSQKVLKLTGDFIRNAIERLYGQECIHDALKDFKGFKDSSEIFCVPGWDPASRNASWVGATPGTDIEGIRANRGYLDDVIDQESTTSEVSRDSAKQWFGLTFLNRLNKAAPITVTGSLWHPMDFHMELLARGWTGHLFPFARREMPEGFKEFPKIIWHGQEYDILWSEEYGSVDLAQFILDHDGEISFQLRFQLNPWVLKDVRFKPYYFHYYTLPLAPDIFSRLVIHAGVDPATGKTDIGSESAITVLGLDKTVNYEYILESLAGIWDPVELKAQIRSAFERWHPKKIYIEDVGAQNTVISDLHVDGLPVYGLSPEGRDKIARIDTLAVPIERGQIQFHISQQELINQLLNFPKAKRLDRADSLEIAHRSFQAGINRINRRIL